jgi:hypothetical protein
MNLPGAVQSFSAPATFVVSWVVYRAMLVAAKRTWFVRG